MMLDDFDMTLPKIRKKYLKQFIQPDKLTEECWNVIIKDSVLTFHYYWEADDQYLDRITMDVDENMMIKYIEPLEAQRMNYCDIRRSDFSPCRATTTHYMYLDDHLSDACISVDIWNSMSAEDKIQKYQSTLDYLASWESRNPLRNGEQSFIPILEKRIKELKGEIQ